MESNIGSTNISQDYREEHEGLDKDELFVRWYHQVMIKRQDKGGRATFFGMLLGLADVYRRGGHFAEATAAVRKAEPLFFKLVEEATNLDAKHFITMSDLYSRYGLHDDALRVADRVLKIVERKYGELNMDQEHKETLMKQWRQDLVISVLQKQARLTQTQVFLEMLSTSELKQEAGVDWVHEAEHGMALVVDIKDNEVRQYFEENIDKLGI